MEIFLKAVWRIHGLPQEIVSDRDPRFVSDFWKALHKRLGTRFNMSTANHPQTDGQAERANGVVEEMLRSYTNVHQDDWDEHLATVEFAYNDSENATTKVSPFYALYGRHPQSPLSLVAPPPPPAKGDKVACKQESIEEFAARMQAQYRGVHAAILEAQERQRRYADLKRRDHEFKVGDQVLLDVAQVRHRNLAFGATRKFASKFEGPFSVKRVVSPVVYELTLPAGGAFGAIHPVLHVSCLKEYLDPANPAFPGRGVRTPVPAQIVADQVRFEVDCFINHRWYRGKRLDFMVQWQGYTPAESTWRPAEQLQQDMGKYYTRFKRLYEERVLKGPLGDKPGKAPAKVAKPKASKGQKTGAAEAKAPSPAAEKPQAPVPPMMRADGRPPRARVPPTRPGD
jgi:hypothetical protein